MRLIRHLSKMLGEFFSFAWENKAWWIIPIVTVLLLMSSLIFVCTTAAPFIYTFF